MNDLQSFLKSQTFPGKVIFAKIWGSKSHNTNKPDSDTDYAGVYVVPTKQILGLDATADTVKNDNEDSTIDKTIYPDFQFHEVQKFSLLLIKGNPGILECLWTEKLYVSSPEWERLRKIRDKFLSEEAIHQYLGYMGGQYKRLVASNGQKGLHTRGGKLSEKWVYHILRLAEDAKRIAKGHPPIVWKDGQELDFLMEIRSGKYGFDEYKVFIEKAIADIEGMKPYNLPREGDKKALNEWLLQIRLENL